MSRVAGAAAPWRGRVLGVWLLLLALGVAVIARSHFSTDLSAFLPSQPDARQRVLMEQLRSGAVARSLFVGIDGGSATQRAAASRGLAAALRASGLFEQVLNGEQALPGGAWQAAGAWLFEHRYQLSPAVDAQRFTEAGLRDAIEDTLSLLGTPAGSAFKPLLERDPTGETQRIAEALLPSQAPRSDEGVWVARTVPRALLLLSTRAAGADLDGQAAAIARVRSAFAPWASQGLGLRLSGPPVFATQSRAQIEQEVKQLALVGSVVMGLLLLAAFASLRALAIAALPVATGIVAGIATVSLVFGSVHGLTLGFGSTLIGEAVDYAIYYLIQARSAARAGGEPGGGWRAWRRTHWPTVRLGLWTSVCGFAVLIASGFTGLAQLGTYSTAGLIAAALTTRWVLPVLMPDGAAGEGLRRPLGRLAVRAVDRLQRLRRPLLWLGVLAAGALVWQGGALWRGSLGSLSTVPRSAIELDEQLRADLSAGESRTLVAVGAPDLQAVLQRAEQVGQRLDALVDQGALAGYDTPTRFLPSRAAQQARQASLPPPELLRERLQRATAGGPLRAERLEPFVAAVDAARGLPPIERQDLAGGPLAPLMETLLVQRPAGDWLALLSLQPPPGRPLDAARVQAALQGVGDVQLIEIGPELARLYDRYLHEALVQAGVGALAVVALLALYLRSLRRLLAVCQPLLLAVLLTLGGLALAGVELGILHLVGLLLVVAVGSNYALFFDQLRADDPGREDTLASLLLANLTTVLSFGLIALSQIPALSAIGRVVAPGALLALLLSAACARAAASAPGPVRSSG